MSLKGLGRGLDALLSVENKVQPADSSVCTLSVHCLVPNKNQPRKSMSAEGLDELARSIRQQGIIQPIIVRRLPDEENKYQIIAGERRWRAARAAGLTEVPVRIIEADDRRAMELALVENLQREDLNPIEEARGFRTLMEDYGLTQEEAASSVGKSRPAVANALRLLSLTPAVLSLVEEGQLSAGHARALIPIRDEKMQLEAAETVIARGLSVRQTEALAARLAKAQSAPKREEEPSAVSVDYVREVERELENALGRKVKLVDGRKKGKIEIEFYGSEDREKLIENLRLFSSLRSTK